MRSIYRLAVLTAGAICGLAFAQSALATQKLEVSQSGSSLTIKVTQAQADPQPANLRIYVPNGYTLTLGQGVNSNIGHSTAEVFARDLGIPLPLEGDVVVGQILNPPTGALACAGNVPDARWDLALSVAGQKVTINVFVTRTTGAETALGVARLDVCLAPVDLPRDDPRRSPNGAQLLSATFTVNGVFSPSTGASLWKAFWTPWGAGTTVNTAGRVETQSIIGPGTVSIAAKVTSRKQKTVTVSGSVRQGTTGAAGKVSILVNGRPRASTAANASGRYSKKVKATGRRASFQARVVVAARDLGAAGCTQTQAPIPCVDATAGGFAAVSRKITVRL